MDNALIKIISGEYRNPDAIENAIKYICRYDDENSLHLYLYGAIPSPRVTISYKNILNAFYASQNIQNNTYERNLWHLVISFPIDFDFMKEKHFRFINEVAQLFSAEYVNCFSYHTDTDNPHFHFIISAASYIPNIPPLIPQKMDSYISQIIPLATTYGIALTQIGEE